MTTHDEHTLTDSPDDPSVAVAEPPPAQNQAAAVAEPAPMRDESAAVPPAPSPHDDTVAAHTGVPEQSSGSVPESSSDDILFAEDELAELRARWAGVQAAFVDDPKDCVEKADGLVSDLVEQLTHGFTDARSRLEEQWSRGEEASTEDLRLALMHYRAFFERLLTV